MRPPLHASPRSARHGISGVRVFQTGPRVGHPRVQAKLALSRTLPIRSERL